ncbi:hypothetical protein QUF88_02145 [Bacillus sp. DX1.1]|uniref:hypothetical protein n=1 Tax=Bacillus sp. DX1.1 TaxID=3055866 RepID=UPI0025A1EC2F|nr:hypothetical protein [Bacillus sp. DX1.1]MDM5152776.1 hypothetical protein [Bacillus sp. DX1.1]
MQQNRYYDGIIEMVKKLEEEKRDLQYEPLERSAGKKLKEQLAKLTARLRILQRGKEKS